MFQKILLPLDLTDRHQQAIDIAANLATRDRGTITLLHVIETIAGLPFEEEKDFYSRLERTARHHLDQWGARCDRLHASWRAEVRYGHRASECVRYTQENGSDLIVLTAPRIDPANPGLGWGSMSYKISVLSQCPVLLVK